MIDRVEDRLAISDLFARYGWGMDLADPTAFGSVWTEDACWVSEAAGLDLRGREAIMAYFTRSLPKRPALPAEGSAVRMVGSPLLRFDGDTAAARSEFVAMRFSQGVVSPYSMGYYIDTVHKEGETWLIHHRDMVVTAM